MEQIFMEERCCPSRIFQRLIGISLTLAALQTLAIAPGCTSALATAAWIIKGPNVPPEFDGLKKKKVAVVCTAATQSIYAYPNVAKDLARAVARQLQKNVKDIKLIPPQDIEEWMDSHQWTEYPEIGQAVGAELLVAIDVNDFRLYKGQTIFQGRADLTIRVFDCATGEVVFERRPPEILYPPNHVVSTAEVREADFRRDFIRVLADHIGRYFYPHDPRALFAADAATIY
jgi:hypothetical protein